MDTRIEQAHVNKQIGVSWLDLEQHVAWHSKYILDQVVCRRDDDGWLLILKAYRGPQPFISFISGRTWAEVWELAGEFAARGVLVWGKDRYPSKWFQRLSGRI